MIDAPHILVVDDDAAALYAAAKALAEAGYKVTTSRNFQDAIDCLEKDPHPNMLITDIVMPGQVHGFALARMALMRDMAIKVLYVTGYDVPTTEAVAKILRKPISGDDLVAEVGAALAA